MGGLVDIEQKGWESVIHDHDRDLLVTKMRCKDLPDGGRGDFRCWCAIDSSSKFVARNFLNYIPIGHQAII